MVSIPAPGHVNPSLEIIRELAARGHRVTYANDPSMESVITETGAELRPYKSTLPGVNHAGVEEGETSDESWGDDAIDALAQWLQHGPPQAQVDAVEREAATDDDAGTAFRIA